LFKRFFKILFYLFLLTALTCGIGLLVGDYIYLTHRFPPNCFLENIDVSLLTPNEVAAKLQGIDVDEGCSRNIKLLYNDRIYAFKPSELGLYIQPVNSANNAFALTYERSYLNRVIKRAKKTVTVAPLTLGAEEESLNDVLKDIAKENDIPSREAEFFIKGYGRYVIKDESIGRTLKLEETVEKIKASLNSYKRNIDLIVLPDPPRIFAKDLAENPPIWLLSKYTTRYGDHDDPKRVHNIKLASYKVDNKIVEEGGTFSLLEALGDITEEKGYKEARVIIAGELVPQYGGGVCQIATTLYNAALLADLKILERRNHAIYFSIYPLGTDAMIYAGESDLKIKNNTGNPILIKSYANDRGLTFKILGPKQNKEVTFSKPTIYVGGKIMHEEGTGIPTEEVFSFNEPFSTKLKKYVKKNGRTISTEIIRSYYRSQSDR